MSPAARFEARTEYYGDAPEQVPQEAAQLPYARRVPVRRRRERFRAAPRL